MLTFASFVGTAAIGVFAVTGAYIWLRWGWIGVVAVWSVRRTLDKEVERAVAGAVAEAAER